LPPGDLLAALRGIEDSQGRRRDGPRWGPRTLDLDLLLYGSQQICTAALTVPHPGLAERPFVLVPLAELAPDLLLPGKGPVARLAAAAGCAGLVRLDP
jgi:2-amino-4-hydroxy-6-hydroxymethyldihydropteridine diphosphokinase